MLHRCRPALVDRGGGRPSRRATQARAWIRTNASSRCFGGELLRVADAFEVEPVGQDHGGGDQRAGERPSSGLVDPRHALEALFSEGTFVPVHGGRSRSPDPSCARRRPDLHERLPDHRVDRHVAEPLRRREPRVPGLEPVVAEHEQHPIGNRLGPVGGRIGRELQVRLVDRLAVDVQPARTDLPGLARAAPPPA